MTSTRPQGAGLARSRKSRQGKKTSVFRATLISLYPEMFPGPLGHSLAGKALAQGLWGLDVVNLRDFGVGKHRAVDDTPAGGGPGMVLRADVLAKALDHVEDHDGSDAQPSQASQPSQPRPRFLLSPRGRPLTQPLVRDLVQGPGVILVCGRFEGVDERVIEARQLQEISIGDYILSGGELAAMALLDAAVRLLPGVMGNAMSAETESFESGLLEHPHYTRPAEFEGRLIPDILTSGNHAKIERWRRDQAMALTKARRPDLIDE